jgi:hypothetical protein
MLKYLKNSKTPKSYRDWPKVKPGEIMMIPKDDRLHDLPDPVVNQENWPDWWKEMPKDSTGSILGCKGIQDYLSHGITVPLWGDMDFQPMGLKEVTATPSDPFFRVERFRYESCEGAPINEGRERSEGSYIKLVSPWLYKTAPGYSLLVLPVAYEPSPDYEVLPAIVNTDYYHNLHVVVRVMSDREFTIQAGTPIYHLIPVKRKDNVNKIIIGLSKMFAQGRSRGVDRFGFRPSKRKGLYRRHQREADAGECPMG